MRPKIVNPKFQRKPTKSTKRIIERSKKYKTKEQKEFWLFNGKERLNQLYLDLLVNFCKKNKLKKPNILVLGSGRGSEVTSIYQELSSYGIKPKIDVFSLTKNLSTTTKKNVRKDLSSNLAFEQINKQQHPKLVKALKGRYDYTLGLMSVGYHTKHPEYSAFATASTLKKNGFAVLDVCKEFKAFPKLSEIEYDKLNLKSPETLLSSLLNIKTNAQENILRRKVISLFIKNVFKFLEKEYPKRKYEIQTITSSQIGVFKKEYSEKHNAPFASAEFTIEIKRLK